MLLALGRSSNENEQNTYQLKETAAIFDSCSILFFLLSSAVQTLHAEAFELVDGDVVGLLPGLLLLLEGQHLGLQLALLLLQLLLGLAVPLLQVVLGVVQLLLLLADLALENLLHLFLHLLEFVGVLPTLFLDLGQRVLEEENKGKRKKTKL